MQIPLEALTLHRVKQYFFFLFSLISPPVIIDIYSYFLLYFKIAGQASKIKKTLLKNKKR